MSSFRVFFAGLVIAVMMVGLGRTGQNDPSTGSAKKRGEKDIAALIEQLSDDRISVREQATQKLMELDEALPALRQALEGADTDRQTRLNRIIAAIERRLGGGFEMGGTYGGAPAGGGFEMGGTYGGAPLNSAAGITPPGPAAHPRLALPLIVSSALGA